MDYKWSLDALYTGFDSEAFQNDLKKLDELSARYQESAARLDGSAPSAACWSRRSSSRTCLSAC